MTMLFFVLQNQSQASEETQSALGSALSAVDDLSQQTAEEQANLLSQIQDTQERDLISALLSGSVELALDSSSENITATELNDGPAGEVKRVFEATLQTKGGAALAHKTFSFAPVITPAENIVDNDVGVPTLDNIPFFSNGKLMVPWTADTNGPAGSKTYAAAVAATGTIDCDDTGTAVVVADGEAVVVDDGENPPVTLEFDTNASVVETNTLRQVDVSAAADDDDVRDALITAITGAPALDITATIGGAGVVNLTNDNPGSAGNVAITDTVTSGLFATTGMAGGSGDLKFPIDVSSIPLLANIPIATKTYIVT